MEVKSAKSYKVIGLIFSSKNSFRCLQDIDELFGELLDLSQKDYYKVIDMKPIDYINKKMAYDIIRVFLNLESNNYLDFVPKVEAIKEYPGARENLNIIFENAVKCTIYGDVEAAIFGRNLLEYKTEDMYDLGFFEQLFFLVRQLLKKIKIVKKFSE